MTVPTSTPKLLFGREPAGWLALVSAAVSLVGAFVVGFDAETQGLVVAFANALLGGLLAWQTRPLAPAAFVAVVQTALPLLVAFGLDWTADQQAVALSAASVVLNLALVRPQVEPLVTYRAGDHRLEG
ncbi:membrane protein [Gordonia phage Sapo]|nr:membrane protein [Gordonia phage Sapo]